MLKVPIIELFLRLIPESFLFIFAGYAFSKNVIDKNRYILSSVILGITGYLVRLLPIDYGIHSVLTLIIDILLITNINKINVVKSIQAGIISTIFMFISEGINIFIIQFILKKDLNVIFQNPVTKTLYGIPSLIIFSCIIGAYYYRLFRKKELKYV